MHQHESVAFVRPAVLADLDTVKILADANRADIGFVLRPALAASIARGWLYVALLSDVLVGFVHFRVRRDGWTTIYEICTNATVRRQGVGGALLAAVYDAGAAQGRHGVQLKCPVGSSANLFYSAMGLCQVGEEAGKKRSLVLWQWKRQ